MWRSRFRWMTASRCAAPQWAKVIGRKKAQTWEMEFFARAIWEKSGTDTFFCGAAPVTKSTSRDERSLPRPSKGHCEIIPKYASVWPLAFQAQTLAEAIRLSLA